MIWSVPLPSSDEPFITQTVSLSGSSYVMTFDWNSRTDRWTFSIDTQEGTPVLHGALLCMGVDLLRTVPGTLPHVPPGRLYVGGTDDPTLDTINQVSLFYVDP